MTTAHFTFLAVAWGTNLVRTIDETVAIWKLRNQEVGIGRSGG